MTLRILLLGQIQSRCLQVISPSAAWNALYCHYCATSRVWLTQKIYPLVGNHQHRLKQGSELPNLAILLASDIPIYCVSLQTWQELPKTGDKPSRTAEQFALTKTKTALWPYTLRSHSIHTPLTFPTWKMAVSSQIKSAKLIILQALLSKGVLPSPGTDPPAALLAIGNHSPGLSSVWTNFFSKTHLRQVSTEQPDLCTSAAIISVRNSVFELKVIH